ncbi:MAG: CD3324 family protein [Lachnospiraceae bacterium]
MGYRRAEEILPIEIIELIQQYVDGTNLYIPRKENHRREWGEGTSYKYELQSRNQSIYRDYLSGMTVYELAENYYLSEKSIQRIIRQKKLSDVG